MTSSGGSCAGASDLRILLDSHIAECDSTIDCAGESPGMAGAVLSEASLSFWVLGAPAGPRGV
jgi:hypothetical protein